MTKLPLINRMEGLLAGISGRGAAPAAAPLEVHFLGSGLRLRPGHFELGLGGVCFDLEGAQPAPGELAKVTLEGARRVLSLWAEVHWLAGGRCGLRFFGVAHQDMVELLELGLDRGASSLFPWEC